MTIPVFPDRSVLPGLAWPVKRLPMWSTLHQPTVSGKDTPLPQWTYPRYGFELAFDMLRSDSNAELQTLMGFYNSMQGSAGVFAYVDPDDSIATDQAFGFGDGTTRSFQLIRAFGGFVEPVLNVQAGPFVKVAGVATSAFTLSFATYGVITFTSPPANGAALTWSGTFAFLCRFDEDQAEFTKFMQPIWEQKGLKFSSIKV